MEAWLIEQVAGVVYGLLLFAPFVAALFAADLPRRLNAGRLAAMKADDRWRETNRLEKKGIWLGFAVFLIVGLGTAWLAKHGPRIAHIVRGY